MGSDHDAVAIKLSLGGNSTSRSEMASTSPRHLMPGTLSGHLALHTEMTCEWIQHVSGKITKLKREKISFEESIELKQPLPSSTRSKPMRNKPQLSGNRCGGSAVGRRKNMKRPWQRGPSKKTGPRYERSGGNQYGSGNPHSSLTTIGR